MTTSHRPKASGRSSHSGLLHHFDQLLRIPSISSTNPSVDMSNQPVVDYLAEQLGDRGFQCELMPCGGGDNETSEGQDKGSSKANLLATLGSGPGGLVLAGHTDTVPMNPELWSVDPLRMTERDGRLYGLGSTDMKGFFALIMQAIDELEITELKQPLIVLATADEETSMSGARELAKAGRPKARYAVIGEPTGMRPIHAHKGVMMETIRLEGRSGHSSDPSLGINAMEAMHDVIGELLVMRREFEDRYRNPAFSINHPTMNLGCIHGGDNPNRICGRCELEFDIRLMPGMDIEETRRIIGNRLRPVADRWKVQFDLSPLFPGVPAFEGPADGPLALLAEKLTGHRAESVAFGTEAPFLQQLGMETIVLGPGDIDQAHQPDEYLALDRVRPCVDLLKELIGKYCLS
jgi:acetylornithine deacetylase